MNAVSQVEAMGAIDESRSIPRRWGARPDLAGRNLERISADVATGHGKASAQES